MGCFLACFGPKDKKRGKQRRRVQVQPGGGVHRVATASTPPAEFIPVPVHESAAEPVHSVPESRDKPEEKSSPITRKKVTFDSKVRTYEHVPSRDEVRDSVPEIEEVWKEGEEEDGEIIKSIQHQSSSEDVSFASSVGSYTPNNRYENCRESDDEDLGDDSDDNDLDDDYDDELDDDYGDDLEGEDEDRDQIDRSRANQAITEENHSPAEDAKRMDFNARDRSAFVRPVLNPIENLTQWKAAKAKGTPPIKHRSYKEDSRLDQESRISSGNEPGFNGGGSFNSKSKLAESNKSSSQEVSVDASLSNWLVSSESTPIEKKDPSSVCSTPKSMCQGSNSPFRSQEDRPILGALTVEEIRQFSATNSPRKSPSRSPDEIPIIGTVGTYWSHSAGSANNKSSHSASSFKGIPNTTSKYREDKKVNWHSTPFEARLERALNKEASLS